MTREIKFRAWLKKEKRIIEPVIQLYFGHMPYIGWYETEQDALEGKLTTAFMDEVVLIEWTGSRDKNGGQYYAEIFKPYVGVLAKVRAKSAAEAMVKCRLLAQLAVMGG